MRKILSLFFAIATVLFAPGTASAQNIQCLKIVEGTINQLELRNREGHENCFYLENGTALSKLVLMSKSNGEFKHKVSFVTFDNFGLSGEHILTSHSNTAGVLAVEIMVTGRNIAFGVAPTTNTSTNKHLTISFFKNGDIGSVVVAIDEATVTAPPIEEPPCVRPINGPACNYLRAPTSPNNSTTSTTMCSAATSIPNGKHPNFDIDKNLASISAQRAQIDKVSDLATREGLRAALMVTLFAPGRPYDLKKKGHKYESSQEFGNYFYGMAAAKMGYSEQTTLTAGAIVQQYQNYSNTNHPDSKNLSLMHRNIVFAAISGLGDNPDDPPQISAGYKAGVNCATTPPVPTNTGFSSGPLEGLGRGWQGGSIAIPPVCSGRCGGGVSSVWVGPLKPIHQN